MVPLVSIREEILTFDSNGLRLAGVLSRPDEGAADRSARGQSGRTGAGAPGSLENRDQQTRPSGEDCAVVLIHGWGGYRIGAHGLLVKLARALARRGLPSLRFDLRGRGDSDGDADQASLDDMIADTLAAGRALSAATGAGRLAALGHCSGGNVALGAATLEPSFDRLVPISTFPFQEQITAVHRAAARRGRWARLLARALWPATWIKVLRGQVRWGRIVENVTGVGSDPTDAAGRNLKHSVRDIPAALAGWRGSALFIYGGADAEDRASLAYYKKFARGRDLDFRFRSIQGANHNFYARAWEDELVDQACRFLTDS